jgi:branched-chain amino acid transport system substrate-binding protein
MRIGIMRGAALLGALLAAPCMIAQPAIAQDTVRIGLIMPYSGQFADTAVQMDNGIKLYLKRFGDSVAGKKIELLRRDTGGIAPDVAKRLAQELIVRDRADILAGFVLTPNALAAGDVSREAKKFMVVMTAATSIITTKSEYMTRSAGTTPQLNETFGRWAYKNGIRKIYMMVSDFGPAFDAEAAFQRGFKESGGEVLAAVRFPVANPDFGAFVQRAKDLNPEAIYVWVPAGAQPAAIGKAFAERGISTSVTKILAQGELTYDEALKNMGDAGLGIITVAHYDRSHESALNASFVAEFKGLYGRNPDPLAVGGFDGMHLIYEALRKTGGKADGESLISAAKGMSWESPRGPVSIDPDTRDIVQTVYIRRVERLGGELRNVEFDRVENVKDPKGRR